MGFADLLTQRGDLERGTASNVDGAQEVAWTLAQADLPVRVRQARPPADLRLGVEQTVTHVVYALPNRELEADPNGPWRLTVDGRRYLLVDVQDAADRGHHLEIRARRLD